MKEQFALIALRDFQAIDVDINDFQVIYSSDDEGNSFYPITVRPSVGIFKNESYTEDGDSKDYNSVCIN